MDECAPLCKFACMQINLHMCKFGHENGALDEFRKKCMSIVHIRIKHHEANYICSNPRMSVTRIKRKLKHLGEKFVFVPADKAANIVVIV